jgi:hypothetical protein
MTPLNRCSLQRFGACWIKPLLALAPKECARLDACAGKSVFMPEQRRQAKNGCSKEWLRALTAYCSAGLGAGIRM